MDAWTQFWDKHEAMLTEYIQAAMQEAHYELMENDRFFGSIPSCKGAWGEAATPEECRENLRNGLEAWLLVGIRLGHELPVLVGIDLNRKSEYAEAS